MMSEIKAYFGLGLFLCVWVLPCMDASTPMWTQCPWRPEEGIGFPGTGLWITVLSVMWRPGFKARSSVTAVSAPNQYALSCLTLFWVDFNSSRVYRWLSVLCTFQTMYFYVLTSMPIMLMIKLLLHASSRLKLFFHKSWWLESLVAFTQSVPGQRGLTHQGHPSLPRRYPHSCWEPHGLKRKKTQYWNLEVFRSFRSLWFHFQNLALVQGTEACTRRWKIITL